MTRPRLRALSRESPVTAIVYTSESPTTNVSGALIRNGHSVLERPWVPGTEQLLAELQPDVVIFYLNPLSHEDRKALFSVVGPHGQPPAVLVVAPIADDQSMLAALTAGAAACLPVSVTSEVLAAQVDALYRSRYRPAGTVEESPVVSVRDLVIDFARRRVMVRGRTVPLTRTEFDILGALAKNPGRVVTGTEVLSLIGQFVTSEAQARLVVKVHLSHLRQKLAVHAGGRDYVQTIRGVGYLLDRRDTDDLEVETDVESHHFAGTGS